MAISYNIESAYTGKRTISKPDPDNEGGTIETEIDVNDVEVVFTDDSYSPTKTHKRAINVCFNADGDYDNDATLVRVAEVMAGVENKMAVGVIT